MAMFQFRESQAKKGVAEFQRRHFLPGERGYAQNHAGEAVYARVIPIDLQEPLTPGLWKS
jgi:hypothetical protein